MRRKGSKVCYFWNVDPPVTLSKAVFSRLPQCWNGVGFQGKSRGCDCTSQMRNIRFSNFSNSWNHCKFHEISSIGQLDIIGNCGVLRTWVGRDAWKVWGLKPLSKQNRSGLAEIRSGNRRSCPESWTYRTNQVVPIQGRSTHESAPPLKRTPPYCCFNLYAPCILYIGQTYRYSTEYSFYVFSQQICLIIVLDFLSP